MLAALPDQRQRDPPSANRFVAAGGGEPTVAQLLPGLPRAHNQPALRGPHDIAVKKKAPGGRVCVNDLSGCIDQDHRVVQAIEGLRKIVRFAPLEIDHLGNQHGAPDCGPQPQGRASRIMLNGVSVALRTLLNPPSVIADDSFA